MEMSSSKFKRNFLLNSYVQQEHVNTKVIDKRKLLHCVRNQLIVKIKLST